MGFSQGQITDADRKAAVNLLNDLHNAAISAEQTGKDKRKCQELEAAYTIGLLRCLEREKFDGMLEALCDAQRSLAHFVDSTVIPDTTVMQAYTQAKLAEAKARAAIAKAT
jgi:hypothetical protein